MTLKNKKPKSSAFYLALIFNLFLISQVGCQPSSDQTPSAVNSPENKIEGDEPDPALSDIEDLGCIKATVEQIAFVDLGNTKLNQFMSQCYAETGNSTWCPQVARPNPDSRSTFICTYGANQQHSFIHPEESTWSNAITAIHLIQELQAKGINVASIYNWWRPEPYNENVGGAPGRHPFGTSVDVRFASKADQEKAHKQLCTWRDQGRLRALGYYDSTALHFGIGDKTANTWGKDCP